jgi:hypothetical protein
MNILYTELWSNKGKYNVAASYVRMRSRRPHTIQDKFWNTQVIPANFGGDSYFF